ncbi:hypothetical protein H2203_004146 [Taxawa tesnikishii (nom. ined.)]|nr:hypothetical protein H2203_004146 [Dothideales sp. JES 119]
MGLISAFTLIRALSLFHMTAAYFFLVSPRIIVDQSLVVVLGEAMRLPHVTTLSKPSESSAFIAFLLFFLGFSDFVAASLPELTALEYWSSQTPVRLFVLFLTTGYVYAFKPDGVFGSGVTVGYVPGVTASPADNLKNSLVFSAGFTEITLWFWAYLLLKDERRALAVKIAEKRRMEENML